MESSECVLFTPELEIGARRRHGSGGSSAIRLSQSRSDVKGGKECRFLALLRHRKRWSRSCGANRKTFTHIEFFCSWPKRSQSGNRANRYAFLFDVHCECAIYERSKTRNSHARPPSPHVRLLQLNWRLSGHATVIRKSDVHDQSRHHAI